MTTDPPPPGSPWAIHCPDAFPLEWLESLRLSALPAGFNRFATAEETALITGMITVEMFVDESRGTASEAPSPPSRTRSKPSKPEGRFAVLNGFVDAELRKRSRAEIALWMILYRDVKPDGIARTGQTDIARRAGCDVRTVKRAVDALEGCGLLEVVTRGRLGCGPSRYRVMGAGTPC